MSNRALPPVALLLLLLLTTPALAQSVPADLNGDDLVNVVDVQFTIGQALGQTPVTPQGDVDGNGVVNVTDVQTVINIALGRLVITVINPDTAAAGDSIGILGGNFPSTAGANQLTIGGASATVTNVRVVGGVGVELTTTVPAGASNGMVVLNGNGATANASFTFSLGPVPSFAAITPSRGDSRGGAVVQISGSNFSSGLSITLGGDALRDLIVLGPTLAIGRVPPAAAGEAGTDVDLVLGPTTASGAFRYLADTTGPSIIATVPEAFSDAAPANTGFAFKLDEPISPGSVTNPNVQATGSTAVFDQLTFTSGSVAVSEDGRWIVLRPSAPLTTGVASQSAAVLFGSGSPVVTDRQGNALQTSDSVVSRDAVRVTLENDRLLPADNGPPSIARVVPSPGAIDVPPGRPLAIEFSEVMDPSSLRSGANATLVLETLGGQVVPTTVDVSADLITALLRPLHPLEASTGYRLRILAGIQDLAGNPLGTATLTFTTGSGDFNLDRLAPAAIDLGTRPVLRLLGAGLVPGSIVTVGGIAVTDLLVPNSSELTFTAPVFTTAGSRAVVVTRPDGSTQTLSPGLDVRIDDPTQPAPEITFEHPPANDSGSTTFAANSAFIIHFSEPMDDTIDSLDTGNTVDVTRNFISIPGFTASFVDPDKRILRVKPNSAVAGTTVELFLLRESGTDGRGLRDLGAVPINNLFATDSRFEAAAPDVGVIFQWQLGPADVTPPSLDSQTPLTIPSGGSNSIALDFNEAIDPLSVFSTVTATDGQGTLPLSLAVDPESLRRVVITPDRAPSGTIQLDVAGLTDLAGNAFGQTLSISVGGPPSAPAGASITINNLPPELDPTAGAGGTLRLPPSGWTLEARLDVPGGARLALDPSAVSLTASVSVAGRSAGTNLMPDIPADHRLIDGERLLLQIPPGLAFPTGAATVTLALTDPGGTLNQSRSFSVEVALASGEVLPFERRDLWVLSYDRDVDSYAPDFANYNLPLPTQLQTVVAANGTADFDEDLTSYGLNSSAGAANIASGLRTMNRAARNFISNRILFHMLRLYGQDADFTDGRPNPGVFRVLDYQETEPLADGVRIRIVTGAAPAGFNRLGIGGLNVPGLLGRADFDPQNDRHDHDNGGSNANLNDGVFPGSSLGTEYDGSPGNRIAAFRIAFDPVTPYSAPGGPSAGAPIGTDAADPQVLDDATDPATLNPAQRVRYNAVLRALDAAARQLAVVGAHEIGHSLGLLVDGAPPNGLYGNSSAFPGSTSTHLRADNLVGGSGQSIMSPTVGFEGAASPATRFNRLVEAYLRNRIIVGQ